MSEYDDSDISAIDKKYQGRERRHLDKAEDIHRGITERHTKDIARIHTDVASLKAGIDNVAINLNRIFDQLDDATKPKESNWTAVGSLIIAIVIVFGGIFGFLFNAQSKSTEDALFNVQRESDLRHEIRDLQEQNITAQVRRLQDRVLTKLNRQDELNLKFIEYCQENTEGR